MGNQFLDQYSYLHFASGIVAYFWGIKLYVWIIIHVLFELIENTKIGMRFINNYFPYWPGGKPKADNIINQLGDNLAAILGHYSAYLLDTFGNRMNWYDLHINTKYI